MPLKYVMLGLLFAKPMHGYALRQAVAPALPRNSLMNEGIIYPLLARLEREGLVEKRIVRAKTGPSRNVFHVTGKGRQEFLDWMSSPAAEDDDVTYDFFLRDPFLAKAAFFRHLSPEVRKAKFEHQREVARSKLETLREVRRKILKSGVIDFHVAILDLGIEQHQAKIRWLEDMAARITDPSFFGKPPPSGRRDGARVPTDPRMTSSSSDSS